MTLNAVAYLALWPALNASGSGTDCGVRRRWPSLRCLLVRVGWRTLGCECGVKGRKIARLLVWQVDTMRAVASISPCGCGRACRRRGGQPYLVKPLILPRRPPQSSSDRAKCRLRDSRESLFGPLRVTPPLLRRASAVREYVCGEENGLVQIHICVARGAKKAFPPFLP